MKEILNRACGAAKALAVEAGEEILEIYAKDFGVEYKDDKSPVTDADKKANDLICKGLAEQFPDMAILAEESTDDLSRLQNDWCFLVDPLDGTKEFVKKNDEFTVNIALSYKGESVMGVIYIPVMDKLYWAIKDAGAYVQAQNDLSRRIYASDNTDNLIIAVSRSHLTDKEQILIDTHDIGNVIQSGSSIKGCLVAEGSADIYYRYGGSMQWDTAAMQIIAEEAGALFRQMDGSEMRYNRRGLKNEIGFFVVNRKENIFEDMLYGR
jgi:3'(2'), 5'-bisphosphate nucleotidase